MAQLDDFTPPIDAGEQETIAFDYGRDLGVGIVIISAVMTIGVHFGTDANAADRLIDGPIIVPSLATSAAGNMVEQMIGGMVADTVYWIRCVATTSDGQQLSDWSRIACQEPC